jgi:pyruvate/2-oxoacid:ferredoxin oxidoreductase beta subunit
VTGKDTAKKDLGMIAMSYGYVYVAQVVMGPTCPTRSRPSAIPPPAIADM